MNIAKRELTGDLQEQMMQLGRAARDAADALARASSAVKDAVLMSAAAEIRNTSAEILQANAAASAEAGERGDSRLSNARACGTWPP